MPPVFASGAQMVDRNIVQAPTPGSDLPAAAPPAPAPESATDVASASPLVSDDETEELSAAEDAGDAGDAGDAPAEPEDAEEQLVLPPTNRGQRRFVSNLIRENERHRAELEAMRQQQAALIQRLNTPPAPQDQPVSSPAVVTPQREQYTDEASYVAALVDYEMAKRDAIQMAQQKSQLWQQRLAQGQKHFADFDRVINDPTASPAPAIQSVLYETVCESEHGARLLYTLGKDPALLRRLNTMTPMAAARELGRLESRLSQPPVPPPAPSRQPSRGTAPRPIEQPVTGGGAPARVGGFRPGMSMREYEAMRREERRR